MAANCPAQKIIGCGRVFQKIPSVKINLSSLKILFLFLESIQYGNVVY